MMRYADHHGFPIITFFDTPGAFADLKSEELCQVCYTMLVFACLQIFFCCELQIFFCCEF